jgi:hypothetical protein
MNNFANTVPASNVYPTYSRVNNLGQSATTPFATTPTDVSSNDASNTGDVQKALAVGATGNTVTWWVSMAALLVLLMYSSQKFDGGGSYSNLKLSAYNILTITLAAIIGISLFKVLFTKFPVPGVSTIIHAV